MYWARHLVKVLKAVEILAKPGGATMDELRKGLDVDRRTSYRIRDTLEELNFPLYEDSSGLDGRKRFRFADSYLKKLPNLNIPELKLSLPELIALYFIRGNRRMFKGTDIEHNIDAAFRKLDAFMPEGLADRLDQVKTLFVSSTKFNKDYSNKEIVIEQLTDAIFRCQTCMVEYHSFHDDKTKSFKIDPLRFFERDGGLYVFIRATRFGDIRVLAVERISQIEPTDATFKYPTDFDPEALLDRSFGMFYDDPLEVKIWFSADQARYIKERQWAQEQKITTRKDGSIELWMKTSGWYDVKKWVLSFGADARVLEPAHLQDKVRKEVEKMLNGYGEAVQ
jgi:predicted DNA-binding transcriptional regulator YafY